jgi:hypothetical protein
MKGVMRLVDRCQKHGVIPAKAGIHLQATRTTPEKRLIPASAGMTSAIGVNLPKFIML